MPYVWPFVVRLSRHLVEQGVAKAWDDSSKPIVLFDERALDFHCHGRVAPGQRRDAALIGLGGT